VREKIIYVTVVSNQTAELALNNVYLRITAESFVKERKFFDVNYWPVTLTICLLLRSNGFQPTFMDRHRRRLTTLMRASALSFTPDGIPAVHPIVFLSRHHTTLARYRSVCLSFRSQ